MTQNIIISKKLVAINSASGILARLLNLTVLVWLQQFLLKRISTDEYSLYPVLTSLIIFLPLMTSVFTLGLARYVIEAFVREDHRLITSITSTMFAILLGLGIILAALGGLVVMNLPHLLNIEPTWLADARLMLGLLLFNVIIATVSSPFQIGLYVTQRFVAKNLVDLACELFRLAVLFFLLIGVSPRVLWVVVAAVISGLIGVVIRIVLSCRALPSLTFRPSLIDWRESRKIMSFGGWTLIATLADRIRLFSDPIVLNLFSNSFNITCYHLGGIPQRTIQSFSIAAQTPFTPLMTNMVALERTDQVRNTFLRGCRLSMWAILAIVVPLVIFAPELIRLWVGESYLLAATVLLFLHLGYALTTSMQFMENLAVATGVIRSFAIRMLCAQLFNLSLTVYLVWQKGWGAIGSAVGTLVTMTLVQPVLTFPLGWRLAGAGVRQWLQETFFPGILPALAAAVFWVGIRMTLHPVDLVPLAGWIVLGLVLYVIVLWRYAARENDLKDVRHIIGKLKGMFRKS